MMGLTGMMNKSVRNHQQGAGAGASNENCVPLSALLGLDHHTRDDSNRFFFSSPLLHQRLSILEKMIGGSSYIIMVLGERGSGKTTLMNQFIANADRPWRTGRIKLRPCQAVTSDTWRNLNNRVVLISQMDHPPSVIIDDAHQLSGVELRLLLQSAFHFPGERKIQSVVLFAEPLLRERISEIARCLPENAFIEKFNMAPLTEKQTADYLQYRIKMAGYLKKVPFSNHQIRRIHRTSGGLPGWINGEACLLLRRMLGNRNFIKTPVGNLQWALNLWRSRWVGSLSLKRA